MDEPRRNPPSPDTARAVDGVGASAAHLQDAHWPSTGPGGALRVETHFGHAMRCFADRPAHIDAMFRATVARAGPREALVDGGTRRSYHELDAHVDRTAGNLTRLGVCAGDRVVLFMGNRPEFLVAVLACARIGAISVPVGIRHVAAEVQHVLGDCAACAILFDERLRAQVPVRSLTPAVRLRLVLGTPDDGEVAATELQAPLAEPAPAHLPDEDDVAVLLYTSGTTGRPKGAKLTHVGVMHSVIHFARCFAMTEVERTLLAVPASHVTGLVSLLLTTVYVGGCTVMLPEFKSRDFLALAARESITYTLMVPAMYELCLRDASLATHDLSSWRIGGFGGSVMPASTIEAIATVLPDLVLHNAYGATETTSPTTLMPAGLGLAHAGSVGQVVPCGEVVIADDSGHVLPYGSPGEICVRGPMVVPGYWNDPAADARGFRDGYWLSGDVGTMDAAGFVAVVDRIKDMINRGGYKVFSAEVEGVLGRHPAVLECAVVGRPDPVLGERVRAVVVVGPDADVDAAALARHCAGALADYKVPEIFELRHTPLPRNANGKILKARLRESGATT